MIIPVKFNSKFTALRFETNIAIIAYPVISTMSKSKFLSLRKLKKLGVQTYGRQIYVESGCVVGRGVKLYSPCNISGSTRISEGAAVFPYSYLHNAFVAANAEIRASTVADSSIGENSKIGPYAYIRNDAHIGNNCRVGDFVEIKNSTLGDGCKAAHLSYIGDATLGGRVNVGCGVVFANYDGKVKRRSQVGDDCFIGCNCNIVAPVNIERGAYIAAGTTVCADVEERALVIGRCRERAVKEGAKGRYLNG